MNLYPPPYTFLPHIRINMEDFIKAGLHKTLFECLEFKLMLPALKKISKGESLKGKHNPKE